MANIVVLEIQRKLITPSIESSIREISKFYEVFKDKVIVILFESRMTNVQLYNVMGGNKLIVVEMYQLNHFARNRLINNFESDRPELTLSLMGAGEDSKLIKVWERHVKRSI